MEYEDYMLTLDGFRMKASIESANLRRQTYLIIDVIARSAGVKNGIKVSDFNRAWPLDEETKEEAAEKTKERNRIGRLEAIKISNDVNYREALKKIKFGGSNKNSHRRRGKSGDQ